MAAQKFYVPKSRLFNTDGILWFYDATAKEVPEKGLSNSKLARSIVFGLALPVDGVHGTERKSLPKKGASYWMKPSLSDVFLPVNCKRFEGLQGFFIVEKRRVYFTENIAFFFAESKTPLDLTELNEDTIADFYLFNGNGRLLSTPSTTGQLSAEEIHNNEMLLDMARAANVPIFSTRTTKIETLRIDTENALFLPA